MQLRLQYVLRTGASPFWPMILICSAAPFSLSPDALASAGHHPIVALSAERLPWQKTSDWRRIWHRKPVWRRCYTADSGMSRQKVTTCKWATPSTNHSLFLAGGLEKRSSPACLQLFAMAKSSLENHVLAIGIKNRCHNNPTVGPNLVLRSCSDSA